MFLSGRIYIQGLTLQFGTQSILEGEIMRIFENVVQNQGVRIAFNFILLLFCFRIVREEVSTFDLLKHEGSNQAR